MSLRLWGGLVDLAVLRAGTPPAGRLVAAAGVVAKLAGLIMAQGWRPLCMPWLVVFCFTLAVSPCSAVLTSAGLVWPGLVLSAWDGVGP